MQAGRQHSQQKFDTVGESGGCPMKSPTRLTLQAFWTSQHPPRSLHDELGLPPGGDRDTALQSQGQRFSFGFGVEAFLFDVVLGCALLHGASELSMRDFARCAAV